MRSLFNNADSFNQPLGDWDVGEVRVMNFMFAFAGAFDQDLSNWDLSSLTTMDSMFRQATAFNQNLCDWEFPSTTVSVTDAFESSGCANTDDPDLTATPPGPLCANC